MLLKRRPSRFEVLESRQLLTAVNIPTDLSGRPGDQVLTPVNIDDAEGIRGADIRINYDTSVLDTDAANVLAGSVWSDSAEVVANVDDAAGTIVVFVFSAEELDAGGGSLLEVRFTIRGDAMEDSTTAIDLAQVRLNEGAIVPDPNPQPGPDSTDGLITIPGDGGNASVSGFVFADTNNNNSRDTLEGLPDVVIVITNDGTGESMQTTTNDLGRYEFADLAAGSYTIEEQQPLAYLDGGPNEIEITLTADQVLTEQNFRELGLRPEFVYNRLFTTVVMPVGSTAWIETAKRIHADAQSGVTPGQLVAPPEAISQAIQSTSNTTSDTTSTGSEDPPTSLLEDAEAEADISTETIADDSAAEQPLARIDATTINQGKRHRESEGGSSDVGLDRSQIATTTESAGLTTEVVPSDAEAEFSEELAGLVTTAGSSSLLPEHNQAEPLLVTAAEPESPELLACLADESGSGTSDSPDVHFVSHAKAGDKDSAAKRTARVAQEELGRATTNQQAQSAVATSQSMAATSSITRNWRSSKASNAPSTPRRQVAVDHVFSAYNWMDDKCEPLVG